MTVNAPPPHADIVIVGGGLAAVRSAEALRKAGHSSSIQVLSDESLLPYDRPPLSKKVLLGAESHDSICLITQERLDELNIGLNLSKRAVAIDRSRKVVELEDGSSISYGKCIIGTGASPAQLPMLTRYQNVYLLRTLQDAQRLNDALASKVRIVVIGAGFIGLEIASVAIARGCSATVVEAGPTPLVPVLGAELGDQLRGWHQRRGVVFHCGTTIREVHGDRRVEALTPDSGARLPVDAVVVGVGQRPNVDWLRSSGLEIHQGLVCDAWGRTSDPDVYGVGDAICCHTEGTCSPTRHWTATTEQAGRVALAVTGQAASKEARDDHYFWSDQHGVRIQFAGHIARDARIEYKVGRPDEDRFLVLCKKGELVTGVFSVGCPRDFLLNSMELRQ